MNFSEIKDSIEVSKDMFIENYAKIKKGREDALERAKHDFIGSKLKSEMKLVNDSFNDELRTAREVFRENVTDVLNKARASEMARLKAVDKTALATLTSLSRVPLSAIEIEQLARDFGGNYYNLKVVRKMAADNNIDTSGIAQLNLPDVSDRISVIDRLDEETDRLINGYKGDSETDYKTLTCLSAKSFNVAEQTYTNGIYEGNLTTRQEARQVLRQVMDLQTDIHRSVSLKDALNRADDRLHAEMIAQVADTSRLDRAVQMSGQELINEVEDFRTNSLADYRSARQAIQGLAFKNSQEKMDTYKQMRSNTFFRDMIQDVAQTDRSTSIQLATAGYGSTDKPNDD